MSKPGAPPEESRTEDEIPNGGMVGPMVGPQLDLDDENLDSNPLSPYSTTRSLIRDLTLPPIPNLDIPPSPPGSPPSGVERKLTSFLELKKQGIHFNENLAKSSASRNPNLLEKLMAFAGLDESEQHSTTLPTELWDPTGFPSWAYRDELGKAREEAERLREEQRARAPREFVDFVPSSSSGPSGRYAGAGGKGLRGSAAERVMAGLDREKPRSPHAFESSSRGSGSRKRSRSPGRRKRSRSR